MLTSFRFKLTLWYSLVLALVLFSFSSILYFGLSRTLQHQIDASLWFIAETEVASMMDSPTGEAHIHEVDPQAVSSQSLLDKYVQLLDHQGRVIEKSSNLGKGQLPYSQELISHSLQGQVGFETIISSEKGSLRLISLPIIDEGRVSYVIQLGTPLQPNQKILHSFLLQLLPLGLGGLVLASLGGWFLARQALKPVGQITETAKAISSQSLDKRLDFKVTHDEIGQLVEVLNEMLNRLEQAFAGQRRFIADASHELRSPLTALKGTLEVLLRRKRTTEEYEQGLGSSLEEINRLARLVNNLLTLARTDTGREELAQQQLRLDRLVEEALTQIKPMAKAKGIQLKFAVGDKISYWGDPDKLKQLVINLLDNALRYTPPGGWIRLSLKQNDNAIQLKVADNGIGIPPSALPHIFERFYRVDQARQRDEPGGSGLGLAICQWIAEAHRGKIEVDSKLGEGSIFTVSLPSH